MGHFTKVRSDTVLALEWQLYKETNTVIPSEVERQRNVVESLP